MSEDMDKKDIEVKVNLTAAEFVALRHLAARLGLPRSAAVRMWIREAIERHVERDSDDEVDR